MTTESLHTPKPLHVSPTRPMPAHLALLLVLAIASPLAADPAGLEGLLGQADAVVVVEILTTDYTATAADGPMYAKAEVIESVKGSLRANQTIRFGATYFDGWQWSGKCGVWLV